MMICFIGGHREAKMPGKIGTKTADPIPGRTTVKVEFDSQVPVAPLSQTVSETFLAMLKQKGVDYLFINSGTDAAPIAEAYARQHLSGLEFPTPIIGTHENLVVGMAHGYTMITGKIQAVMVHVSVGAANAVCAVMNARRDEIPML